jgi:hypothetical protein
MIDDEENYMYVVGQGVVCVTPGMMPYRRSTHAGKISVYVPDINPKYTSTCAGLPSARCNHAVRML